MVTLLYFQSSHPLYGAARRIAIQEVYEKKALPWKERMDDEEMIQTSASIFLEAFSHPGWSDFPTLPVSFSHIARLDPILGLPTPLRLPGSLH